MAGGEVGDSINAADGFQVVVRAGTVHVTSGGEVSPDIQLLQVRAARLNKQIQRIVVPRFRGLIVWGAIIKVFYQCQNFWYEWKGIITRNVHVHVKYESHISNGAQVTSNVKVLKYVCQKSRSRLQGQKL